MNNEIDSNLIFKPSMVIPPGETLKELMESNGMTQVELAKRMGRPLKLVNEIIKGHTMITPETSIQLEKVFGKPASFWNNLESSYQEVQAREVESKKIKDEISFAREYPYNEMAKNGWVKDTKNITERVENLLTFFGVTSLKYVIEKERVIPSLVQYRVSSKKNINIHAVVSWLREGVIQAQKIHTNKYNKASFSNVIQNIRQMTKESPDVFIPKIEKFLANAGVVFVITKNLKNTPINGASYWLGTDKVIIQLSIYNKFSDIFWFSLFHEIGHILKHGKKDFNVDFGEKRHSLKEIEADEFSQDILIPRDKYMKFVEKGVFSKESVKSFAKNIDVEPGVVVGRLQHDELISYKNLTRELRKRYEWS